ncbi:MAG TPA: hypothetical protein VFI27_01655 [candidate division Zixibacteria bacterium]|nr:hypothetical protein [candidate division Zixibacteria bacterium]
MSSTLYAGASRRVINPRLGTSKAGLRLFADPIQAIESDLTGSALVLSNGVTKVVILAIDLCVVSLQEAMDIRSQVAEALKVPSSCVMLNLSHNHSSPALPGWLMDTPEQLRLKEAYKKQLTRWLVEAAIEADEKQVPARIAADRGESFIGVYRRESGPDGRDVLGEVPDHPIDPTVGVIRVDGLDGNPIATLFSYGCHPVTVGPRSMVASTDFPGPARDIVERSLGGIAIFLQACGGNINPRVGIGYEIDCRDAKNRVGYELGGEVLKVAAKLRTHLQAGERSVVGNVPNILLRPWQPVEGASCTYLGAVEEIIKLEYIDLPSMEKAEAIRTEWKQTLAQREANAAQEWEIRVAAKFNEWAEKLVEAVDDGHPTLDVVAQAFRINDIVLAGINMEVFFETGLEIKARSPFENTLVLGYSNGSVGYLPRFEDYPPGGWKLDGSYAVPDLLVQAYTLPIALHPDSEQLVVERVSSLLGQLT